MSESNVSHVSIKARCQKKTKKHMIAQQENTESSQGGLLWTQLRKFVTLVDELRDLGLQDHINLPRIAVLGVQSAGKSSALESIVGLDFLPRGDVQQFIKIFRELLQEDHLNYVFITCKKKLNLGQFLKK